MASNTNSNGNGVTITPAGQAQPLEEPANKRLRQRRKSSVSSDFDLIKVDNLAEHFPQLHAHVPIGNRVQSGVPYSNVITEEQGVLQNVVVGRYRMHDDADEYVPDGEAATPQGDFPKAYPRCGPRAELYFSPSKVVAGIVTCGGLCPGLNSVVRDVTVSLIELYGVSQVYGFYGGWEGIYARPPMKLTRESTAGIQNLGGTILCSARGGFDLERILNRLDELKIDQLYVVGGDGTMRGAAALCEGLKSRGRPIAILGIPKTIDNDIDLIDRSFGFQTAVEESLRAVRSARVEASCNINGVGIVKVMGRSAGFIATHVTLASGEVDCCLIPEVPIICDGSEHCQFKYIAKVVKERGSAVIVVAEGAGEQILGQSAIVDAGGNRKIPEIGPWLKDRVLAALKKEDINGAVKFIDPSYMVRSGPANASDALYCYILSQGAVHAAMAGMTNCTAGLINGRSVLIPIESITATSPRAVDAKGRTWERVVSLTGQPNIQIPPTPVTKSKGLMSHTVL